MHYCKVAFLLAFLSMSGLSLALSSGTVVTPWALRGTTEILQSTNPRLPLIGGSGNERTNSPPPASPQQQDVKESSPERVKLKVPAKKNETPSHSSISDLSSISVIPNRNDNNSDDSDEPEDRATRRARGKSVYLTCFAGIDCIYFIIRLVVFLRVDVFHDAYLDATKVTVNEVDTNNGSDPNANSQEIASTNDISNREKYFCGIEELEAHCAWIFSVGWLCYFLANVSLIFSILWLSLLLCYAYVFLKALSVTVHFLGLITFGFRCLSQKFYIETAVFFIFHLPLQIFGSKRAKNFGVSLKRAKQEKLAMIIAAGVATSNHEVSTAGVRPVKKKKSGYHLSRRPSYHVVTTVD